MGENKNFTAQIIHRQQVSDKLVKALNILINADFAAPELKFIKGDKGHEVYKWCFQGQIYFIKNYAYRRWSKRIKNYLRRPRAFKVVKYHKRLTQAGVATAPIRLALDYSPAFFSNKSLVLSKKVKGQDLEKYLNENQEREKRRQALESLSRAIHSLYVNKVILGDPSLHNYFYQPQEAKMILLDLDNLRQYPFLPEYLFYRSLAKLLALTSARKMKFSLAEQRFFLENILSLMGKNKEAQSNILKKIYRLTNKRLKKWGKAEMF